MCWGVADCMIDSATVGKAGGYSFFVAVSADVQIRVKARLLNAAGAACAK